MDWPRWQSPVSDGKGTRVVRPRWEAPESDDESGPSLYDDESGPRLYDDESGPTLYDDEGAPSYAAAGYDEDGTGEIIEGHSEEPGTKCVFDTQDVLAFASPD